MRVLVTGAAGSIGSVLCPRLAAYPRPAVDGPHGDPASD